MNELMDNLDKVYKLGEKSGKLKILEELLYMYQGSKDNTQFGYKVIKFVNKNVEEICK